MKTVLILWLILVAPLNVGLATVSAQQKISAQDFVLFVFRQLNAFTDHHEENVSNCLESITKCQKAMRRNVERDNDTLTSLDKLIVPSCLAKLRVHFREILLAHREVSAAYAEVLGKPRAADADLKKVADSQRRERVDMVATIDDLASNPASACGDDAGDTIGLRNEEP